jgi:hypothetical protein
MSCNKCDSELNEFYLQAVENRDFVYLHRDGSSVIFFQVLEVEVSIGGSTESNVKSFEAFVTIYLSITQNI